MNRTWVSGALSGVVMAGALLLVARGLNAQNSPAGGSGKIASVDVVKVFNEYQRQKDLTEEMKKKQEELERDNAARRSKIDSMQAALDALNPDDPVYASKARELMTAQIEYKSWFDVNDAGVKRETAVWTARVYREVLKAATDIGQQGNYDAVFYRDEFAPNSIDINEIREQIRNRKLLYASPAIDVSQQVLDTLNNSYRAQPKKPMIQVP